MEQFGTSAKMKDTLCSTISNWFDNISFDPSKYPSKYTIAIKCQNAIGWHHLFIGHLSTEWTKMHGPFETPIRNTAQSIHVWEAAVVEVSLQWFLDLWEACNNDVHRHTKSEQTTRLQALHRITAPTWWHKKPWSNQAISGDLPWWPWWIPWDGNSEQIWYMDCIPSENH